MKPPLVYTSQDLDNVESSRSDWEDKLDSFSADFFFIGLLPPIIFNSGFHLKRHLFFSNIQAITVFAIFGTLASAAGISQGLVALSKAGWLNGFEISQAQAWTFGALISATDPVSTLVLFAELRVEPNLFYIVFGESVLNDAVGLVLFQTASAVIGHERGGEYYADAVRAGRGCARSPSPLPSPSPQSLTSARLHALGPRWVISA